jgi:hypothetical protein
MLLVLLLHAVAFLVWLSVSISLDFSSMIDTAFTIINSLWPLFVVPIGFMFGLGLMAWIIDAIRKSLPGHV